MRHRNPLLVGLAGIAVALSLAACGGGSKSSSTAASNSSSNSGGSVPVVAQQAASTAPEYLGSFAPQSGLGGKVPHKTIGFVNVLGTSANAQACQAEFLRAAHAVGWTVHASDAEGDPAKMAADVSAAVTAHSDAVVTIAIEQSAAAQGLAAAKAAGIPTISICGAI